MPGIARIGSTLTKGLDGQTITARTSPEAQRRRDVGVRPGERHAVES